MKHNLRLILVLTLCLFLLSFTSKAFISIPDPEIVALPHTFDGDGDSYYIDINGDENPDFIIEYVNGAYYINGDVNIRNSIDGNVNDAYSFGNLVFVESDGQYNAASQMNGALTKRWYSPYVSILPYLTPIEVPVLNYNSNLQDGSLNVSMDSYWSYKGIILGELLGDALQATTKSGATDGYIGVYYNTSLSYGVNVSSSDKDYVPSSSYRTGWLHYQFVEPGVFRLLSAGSATAPDESVNAGAGDPFGGVPVPVSMIGSFLALLAIGGGSYFKRKRKK